MTARRRRAARAAIVPVLVAVLLGLAGGAYAVWRSTAQASVGAAAVALGTPGTPTCTQLSDGTGVRLTWDTGQTDPTVRPHVSYQLWIDTRSLLGAWPDAYATQGLLVSSSGNAAEVSVRLEYGDYGSAYRVKVQALVTGAPAWTSSRSGASRTISAELVEQLNGAC